MIDINKKYTTRDGREVVIYAVYDDEVQGAYKKVNNRWEVTWWLLDGRFTDSDIKNPNDLIEVQEVTIWANIVKNGDVYVYPNHAEAIKWGNHWTKINSEDTPIALKRITVQYREGEFDE
jgi:hypothetical protein